MADTPDTPTTTEHDGGETPRARTKRGTAKTAGTTRRSQRKSAVEQAGDAVTAAAGETGRRVRGAAAKAEGAVTAAATETVRRTRRGAAKAEDAVASAAKAVKPRSSSRAKPHHAAADKRKKKKKGGGWRIPAIVGGLAAAGGLAAVLTRKGEKKAATWKVSPRELGGAHQPDGTDSSKSFEAKIADENTIPDAPTPEAKAPESA